MKYLLIKNDERCPMVVSLHYSREDAFRDALVRLQKESEQLNTLGIYHVRGRFCIQECVRGEDGMFEINNNIDDIEKIDKWTWEKFKRIFEESTDE